MISRSFPKSKFFIAFITILSLCLPVKGSTQQPRSSDAIDYLLGPGDLVKIRVLDADEIGEGPYRIDLHGDLTIPLLGRVHAGGLSTSGLEANLTVRLRAYMIKPQITVFVTEYQSQPVSVLGAVNKPGVYQIQGRKTLFEVLSEADGLKTEAGNAVIITRQKTWGDLPLPGAKDDPSGRFSTAELSFKSMMNAANPTENIVIRPNDVITVPRAELVYVIGAVRRSGGFVLTERSHLSVLQALSMAEGLERTASAEHAAILRKDEANPQAEIKINLKKILTGSSPDVPLRANDILFVPTSAVKSAALRSVEAAVQMGTGVVIYRR